MDEQQRAQKLDEALSAMQQRGLSLEDVLSQQPDSERWLRPLLLRAERMGRLSPEGPGRRYVVSTRHRLMNRIAHRRAKRPPKARSRRRRFGWLRRPAMAFASLALAFVLLLSMTGVVYASSESLPGDTFYGVKRGVEQARLSVTLNQEGRVSLLHSFANERLEEVQELQRLGRSEDLPTALAEYTYSVDRVVDALAEGEGDPEALNEIESSLNHHSEVLESLLAEAPEAAQPGLQNALEKSGHGQDTVDALQAGQDPSELAPGQQDETETPGGGPPEGQGPEKTPPGLDPERTPGPPEDVGPPEGKGPPG